MTREKGVLPSVNIGGLLPLTLWFPNNTYTQIQMYIHVSVCVAHATHRAWGRSFYAPERIVLSQAANAMVHQQGHDTLQALAMTTRGKINCRKLREFFIWCFDEPQHQMKGWGIQTHRGEDELTPANGDKNKVNGHHGRSVRLTTPSTFVGFDQILGKSD